MLLSRVADQLYWAARYIERAELTARVVGEHTHLLVDLPASVPLTWEPLLAVTGSRREFDEAYPDADERNIIAYLLAHRENRSSVLSSVIAARENLRTAREVIPREAWQTLNDLCLFATSHHAEAVDRRSRGRFLDKVVGECQRFAGIVAGTMNRDEAYQMLRLGRAVERADMTSRVLDVRAVALLAGPTPADGCDTGPATPRHEAPLSRLHDALDEVQSAIGVVHDAVQASYFPPPPGTPTTDGRDGARPRGTGAADE